MNSSTSNNSICSFSKWLQKKHKWLQKKGGKEGLEAGMGALRATRATPWIRLCVSCDFIKFDWFQRFNSYVNLSFNI